MPAEKRVEKNWRHKTSGLAQRLRGRRDIDALFRQGKRLQGKYLSILYRSDPDGETRYAVFVPKRMGVAVRRNRTRRVLRETLRVSGHPALEGKDIIILCRLKVDETFNTAARREMMELLDRLDRNS